MDDLIREIENLSREQALEAAGFVSDQVTIDAETDGNEAEALEPLTDQPYQNIEEIEQLARLLLITAALTPEYQETVRRAIEGAGEKQFILGGAEIVALAVLTVGALHVLVSEGKESEEEVITIESEGDKTTTTIHRTTKYGISGRLGSMLRDTLALP